VYRITTGMEKPTGSSPREKRKKFTKTEGEGSMREGKLGGLNNFELHLLIGSTAPKLHARVADWNQARKI